MVGLMNDVVLRAVAAPTYESGVVAQLDQAIAKQGPGDLETLLNAGDTWVVE